MVMESVSITVAAPVAPSVTITGPVDGTTFASGEMISFEATASDTEDGDLTTDLVWTSDIDGPIGTGGSFSMSTLSEGAHLITASVTDSGGLSGESSVSMTVERLVTITFLKEGLGTGSILHNGLNICDENCLSINAGKNGRKQDSGYKNLGYSPKV